MIWAYCEVCDDLPEEKRWYMKMIIDPQAKQVSKEFISFALKEWDERSEEIILVVFSKVVSFFSEDKKKLRKALEDKLLRGAKEHGAPIYSARELKKETEDEYIDLVGWELVREFNENRLRLNEDEK
jgi:excinuclease UvrABC ATPase subunit